MPTVLGFNQQAWYTSRTILTNLRRMGWRYLKGIQKPNKSNLLVPQHIANMLRWSSVMALMILLTMCRYHQKSKVLEHVLSVLGSAQSYTRPSLQLERWGHEERFVLVTRACNFDTRYWWDIPIPKQVKQDDSGKDLHVRCWQDMMYELLVI